MNPGYEQHGKKRSKAAYVSVLPCFRERCDNNRVADRYLFSEKYGEDWIRSDEPICYPG